MTARELIEKYNIRASKSLGQNFLNREDMINAIADASSGADNALEIGAGPGLLTHALCKRFSRVTTVEIDRSLSEVTREVLADCDNHTMVYADFLKVRLPELITDAKSTAVVGNLPYNITGEIVTKLIKNHTLFDYAVIMIQREAAEKLCALPGSPQYRAISVLTQYFCDITPLFDLSPDCFVPSPAVTSRVIRLDIKKQLPVSPERETDFIMFVHRVFCQRRKLFTSIFQTSVERDRARKALTDHGFSEKARGEDMTPVQLAELFTVLICEQK